MLCFFKTASILSFIKLSFLVMFKVEHIVIIVEIIKNKMAIEYTVVVITFTFLYNEKQI